MGAITERASKVPLGRRPVRRDRITKATSKVRNRGDYRRPQRVYYVQDTIR